ncbi:MAG: hypothetical protein GY854_23245 [Deltaproteobacteria bacterium]|nr:hypothetical protein [Deltaproteobacteria bacterium]
MKKAVVFVILVFAAVYFGSTYWEKERQAEFCIKAKECASEKSFYRNYKSVGFCSRSNKGLKDSRKYRDCDTGLDCKSWISCGYGPGESPEDPLESDEKNELDEILPHI